MKNKNAALEPIGYPDEEDYTEEATNTAYGFIISCVTVIVTLAGMTYGVCLLIDYLTTE